MESINDEKEFLTLLTKTIASQFGDRCEVVLHDLERSYDSTIVSIENGHLTGRKIGDPGTNLGLEILRGETQDGNRLNYITQTKEGKVLRSSSIYLKNSQGKTIGALCINYDISDLMIAEDILKSLTTPDPQPIVQESFVSNVSDLLDSLISVAQETVGKPVIAMTKENKVQFIHWFDKKGGFLIKKAGERICTYLDISKYTLYNYLEESKQLDIADEDKK
ncbi:helix-turn-helix transcriptional regulator [Sporosarcina sp. FSL K6-3457]|uniref:helix-turn-helix transcriptional regulator n=1 Tax=Sporosarcina sp. FSL K6-3457 TaxID=2978204 RepID=UPI0030F771D0